MDYLPVFLDVRGRTALVVGGGKVALRKAELLVQAGALPRVVAPAILPALAELAERHGGSCEAVPFAPGHLEGAALVIVATGVSGVDAAVHREAGARGVPVNVADRPELCTFILPAVVDRSPVIVAFSTGGRVPVLARSLRARLEAMLPAGLGRLADYLGARRSWQHTALSNIQSGTSSPRHSCCGSNPQCATIHPRLTRARKIQTTRPNQGCQG